MALRMADTSESFECRRFRQNYMCAFQKQGPREPCDRCPNNPANLRRRIEALEEKLAGGKR